MPSCSERAHAPNGGDNEPEGFANDGHRPDVAIRNENVKRWNVAAVCNRLANLRACLKNGRDRSPQRSGECMADEFAHGTLENRFMFRNPPPILADRPEVDPRLG